MRLLFVSDLIIVNSVISGCNPCIRPETQLSVYVTNSEISESHTLIYEFYHFTNDLAVFFRNSAVSVTRYVVALLGYEARVTIHFENSSLTSKQDIVRISGSIRGLGYTVRITAKDSHFESPTSFDISYSRHMTLDIHNNTFVHKYGTTIYARTASVNAVIDGNAFRGPSAMQIEIGAAPVYNETAEDTWQVIVSNNRFDSSYSMRTRVDFYVSSRFNNTNNHSIVVSGNDFVGNRGHSVRVMATHRHRATHPHRYSLVSNRFIGAAATPIQVTGAYQELNIRDNLFQDSRCNEHLIEILASQGNGPAKITGNRFIGNYPRSSVIDISSAPLRHPQFYVIRNNFVNNAATLISTNTSYVSVHENFFENIDNYAFFTIYVTATGQAQQNDVINASLNYWGTSDVSFIARRIYDKSDNATLAEVQFLPFLASRDVTDIISEPLNDTDVTSSNSKEDESDWNPIPPYPDCTAVLMPTTTTPVMTMPTTMTTYADSGPRGASSGASSLLVVNGHANVQTAIAAVSFGCLMYQYGTILLYPEA